MIQDLSSDGDSEWIDNALYTPDGAYLVLSAGDDVEVRGAQTHEVIESDVVLEPVADAPFFRMRMRRIGRVARRLREHSMAARPDGKVLALERRDGSVSLLELPTRVERRRLPSVDDAVLDLAWHPDGTHLAVCGSEGTIRIFDAESPSTSRTISASECVRISISPDGRYLAAAGGALPVLRLFDFERGELRALVSLDEPASAVSFSPDAEWLAVGSSSGRLEVREARVGLRRDALAHALVRSAESLKYAGRFSRALAELELAEEIGGAFAELWRVRFETLLAAGRADEALAANE